MAESRLHQRANQIKLLQFIRAHGKVKGAGSAIGMTDHAVRAYLQGHKPLEMKVKIALDQYQRGDVDDLQTYWNANADDYNRELMAKIIDFLIEGEVTTEERERYIPVKDKRGKIKKGADGKPVLELQSVNKVISHKPTPQYIIKMASELMQNRFGQPELSKVAPTIILKFVQFVQREGDAIHGQALHELIGLAENFDKELKQEVLALTGKSDGKH